MNIFSKRPLALILCITLSGFVASSSEEVWLRVCALFAIPLLILLSLLIKNGRRVLILSSVLLIISVLFSHLYFDFWFYPEKRFGDEVEITAEITAIQSDDYGYKMFIDTDSVDGALFSHYSLVSYISRDEAAPLQVGDVISFRAALSGFSNTDGFDSRKHYASDGINARADILGEIDIISHRENLFSEFKAIREDLRRRAIMQSDATTGNLVSALLLGEKDMLSDQLKRDFKYIGIMHTLALSGMHLAILTVGISKLLMVFGVGRRARDIISILFTALYMAFTGFPVSVMRAGFMLIISSLLTLLSRTKDSFTSLFIAVFIICIVTPYAIFDIALWLSAFATLGLVVLGEYYENRSKKTGKLSSFVNWCKTLILSSVFAVCATLPFSAVSFGGLSLLSPISTLVFSPLIELIMYIGTVMLILGDIFPIGSLLSPVCKFTQWLAGVFASVEGVYASVNFTLTTILIIGVSVLLFLFMILKIRHKREAVCIITASFFVMLGIAYLQNQTEKFKDNVIFESSDNTSYLVIKSSGDVGLICSASSNYEQNYIINALQNEHISRVDKLYITHYSFGISKYISDIASRCDIKEVLLPTPRSVDEKTHLDLVRNSLADYRMEISTYSSGEEHAIGKTKILPTYLSEYEDKTKFAFKITDGDVYYAYLSSGILEGDTYGIAENLLRGANTAIFASVGYKHKEAVYLKSPYQTIRRLIISSENLFITQNVKKYYLENGTEIIMHPEKISAAEKQNGAYKI